MPRYVRVGQSQSISGLIRNAGPGRMMSFNVGWRWNNGPVNMGQPLGTGANGLGGDNMAMFTHPVPFSLPLAQEGVLKVWVDGANEQDRRNDTITMQVTALDRWAEKHVLVQIRSSLNCHNCQQARPRMDALGRYPQIELSKFHHEDDLAVKEVDAYFERYDSDRTPSIMMDQGELGCYRPNANHSQWNRHLKGRLEGVSPVLCWVYPIFDPRTRTVTATITSQFTTVIKGEFAVNAMVLMNDMYGSGGAGSPYYHQVVRGLLGGVEGHTGAIPSAPRTDTKYALTYTFTLPEDTDPERICITGFVTLKRDGKSLTLNARTAALRTLSKAELVVLPAVNAPTPNGDDDVPQSGLVVTGLAVLSEAPTVRRS